MNSTYNEVASVQNSLTPEYRRLIRWMRLFTLGALVAAAGIAGIFSDHRTDAYALLALAGALLVLAARSRLLLLMRDSQEAEQVPAAPAIRLDLMRAARHA